MGEEEHGWPAQGLVDQGMLGHELMEGVTVCCRGDQHEVDGAQNGQVARHGGHRLRLRLR